MHKYGGVAVQEYLQRPGLGSSGLRGVYLYVCDGGDGGGGGGAPREGGAGGKCTSAGALRVA